MKDLLTYRLALACCRHDWEREWIATGTAELDSGRRRAQKRALLERIRAAGLDARIQAVGKRHEIRIILPYVIVGIESK